MQVDPAHPSLGGKRDEGRLQFVHFPGANAVFFFRQDDDRPAFGRFIREGGQLRGIGEAGFLDAGRGMKCDRHAIAEGDRAGLVEEQNVDVARGFDRASAGRENIMPNESVDAADPDRAEQSADGGWNQADEERDENRQETLTAVVCPAAASL